MWGEGSLLYTIYKFIPVVFLGKLSQIGLSGLMLESGLPTHLCHCPCPLSGLLFAIPPAQGSPQ